MARTVSAWLVRLGSVGLVLMAIIVGWQVFGRFVLQSSPSWTEQASLVLMIWYVMFVTAAGVYEEFHIRITLLEERLGDRAVAVRRMVALVGPEARVGQGPLRRVPLRARLFLFAQIGGLLVELAHRVVDRGRGLDPGRERLGREFGFAERHAVEILVGEVVPLQPGALLAMIPVQRALGPIVERRLGGVAALGHQSRL